MLSTKTHVDALNIYVDALKYLGGSSLSLPTLVPVPKLDKHINTNYIDVVMRMSLEDLSTIPTLLPVPKLDKHIIIR